MHDASLKPVVPFVQALAGSQRPIHTLPQATCTSQRQLPASARCEPECIAVLQVQGVYWQDVSDLFLRFRTAYSSVSRSMQVQGCGKPVDGADARNQRKVCSDCRTAAFVSVMIRSTGEMEHRKWCSQMHTFLSLPEFQDDDGRQRR